MSHLELAQKIYEDERFTSLYRELINEENKTLVIAYIRKDFSDLFSKERLEKVLLCLELRFDKLIKIVT
jgi:hypothetical protein